ncbi:hypothetical protein Q2T40_08375 [Winogradskyella maritima]|uniref:Tetratricopeptide repeat protein n=1 Tax=Winogradskyella maritima TaxID=1517766 RepID=A0ABV8AJK3_9FLAO|nr:hypothetical protein [Winogradskyella maritima]
MKNIYIFVVAPFLFFSCKNEEVNAPTFELKQQIEAITLLGDTLRSPSLEDNQAYKNYQNAKIAFENAPKNADSIIWFGRRTAYLGYFKDAIDIYSYGNELYPEDARFLRHRGHRYISIRQYDKAISDFEKAVQLIKGKKDMIEPDGLPNARNLPLSTLHGNIYYHLGLAYYLKGDMTNALKAYSNRTVTEKYPDNLVSGGYWQYMIQRRLGNDEKAKEVIENIDPEMDIIENMSYHTMCLFFKNELDDLKIETIGTSSSDVLSYGLGNWYLFEQQDSLKAQALYGRLLREGNPYSFAYLAAESDWNRLFAEND